MQLYAGNDAQHAYGKEKSNADANGDQQYGVIDVGYCLGQNLQIWLRYGNSKAQHKADDQDQR